MKSLDKEGFMKIGIMTWFQYHNYGTSLQVVALSKVLNKLGQETSVINYKETRSAIFLHKENVVKDVYIQMKNRIEEHPYHRYEEKVREEKFESFLKKNLKFTKRVSILPEFEDLNDEFDAFVCGSDQIWSPSFYNPRYFLDFVIDDYKKIAYAPSIGTNKIDDDNTKAQMIKHIERIKYISTREKTGADLIENNIGRHVETVLDPTLLLTEKEWEKMTTDFADNFRPYLLVYMLGRNEKYWKNIYEIAKRLKLEVKIIPVFFRDLKREGCIKKPVGPEDFLSLIKNAQYICTDSFHGMIFSINFRKSFCIFERFKANDQSNQNSRIYNALDMFGLESRIYKKESKNCIAEIYRNIDYSKVSKILDAEREKSINYLINALDGVLVAKNTCKKNISNGEILCCGCGVCEKVCPTKAIAIEIDNRGFYRSVLDEKKCISRAMHFFYLFWL